MADEKIHEPDAEPVVPPRLAGEATDDLVKVRLLKPRLVGSHNYAAGDEFRVDQAVAAEIVAAGDGIAEPKLIHGQYIPPSDGVHVTPPNPVPPKPFHPIPPVEHPPPPPERTGEVRTDPPRPAPNSGPDPVGQEKAVDFKDEPAPPVDPPKVDPPKPARNPSSRS